VSSDRGGQLSRTITVATDLGDLALLKHGNVYLLSDALGDIHDDARGLGLSDRDTRVLWRAVLRVRRDTNPGPGRGAQSSRAGSPIQTWPSAKCSAFQIGARAFV
jgi:hypothetical protein